MAVATTEHRTRLSEDKIQIKDRKLFKGAEINLIPEQNENRSIWLKRMVKKACYSLKCYVNH